MDPPTEEPTKRKNKWTLGNIFRRRKQTKGDIESTDSSSGEDEKRHKTTFLGRRRSSRKRRENVKNLKQTQPWSGSANSLGSSEGFGSHSSLTRKDRREMMKARVEATRKQSSSDDDYSPNSKSNLTRFTSDESMNKKSRSARTERYLKRLSKDDESLSHQSLSKSDIEIHPPTQNWNATVVYRENSPFVHPVSATSSPVVSPRMQHRVFPSQVSPQLPRAGRRSYCEPPRSEIVPQNYRSSSYNNNIHLASNTNGLPNPMYFYPTRNLPHPPPPPPRDPQRKLLLYNGTPEYLPFVRSRSDHSIQHSITPEPVMLTNSASQTQFQYLADKAPRSRRPIHVVPIIGATGGHHEQSPECTMPVIPAWLRDIPDNIPKQENIPRRDNNNSIPRNEVSKYHHTTMEIPQHLSRHEFLRQDIPKSDILINKSIRQGDVPVRGITRPERAVSVDVQLRTNKTPPPPPVRRYSRHSSVSSIEDEPKRNPSNLEDALNELEAIYQSLRLGDEDLLDRAERRDLPTAHQNIRHEPSTLDLDNNDVIIRRTQRAPPNRRSGIPDLITDDMAYRRLKPATPSVSRDRQSGSYLLVSPALSPVPGQSLLDPEEPDTTYDDMSYRAIKTANSLKVIEPQPPFGIPLVPAPAAPDSDYLHVQPKDKFRPTLRPRKTPDVVKDDLAFRNLRKDNTNKLAEMKRKRAVRSLSANLMSLMEKQDIEKTQSLNNLPRSLQVLIENNDLSYNPKRGPPPSWIERANLLDTSTETLTQSRANLRSLRNSFFNTTDESRPNSLFIPQHHVTPIKEDLTPPVNPLDEEKLDELLSALAKEAHDTSERLGLELERLRDGSRSIEDLTPTQGIACPKSVPHSLPSDNNIRPDKILHSENNLKSNYIPVYDNEPVKPLPRSIFFTGDVNNNKTTETSPEISEFSNKITKITPRIDEISPEISAKISEFSNEISENSPEISEYSPEISEFYPQINEISLTVNNSNVSSVDDTSKQFYNSAKSCLKYVDSDNDFITLPSTIVEFTDYKRIPLEQQLCTILEENIEQNVMTTEIYPTITIEEYNNNTSTRTKLPDLISNKSIEIDFNEVYKLNITTEPLITEENVIEKHEICTTVTEIKLKPLTSIDRNDDVTVIPVIPETDKIQLITDSIVDDCNIQLTSTLEITNPHEETQRNPDILKHFEKTKNIPLTNTEEMSQNKIRLCESSENVPSDDECYENSVVTNSDIDKSMNFISTNNQTQLKNTDLTLVTYSSTTTKSDNNRDNNEYKNNEISDLTNSVMINYFTNTEISLEKNEISDLTKSSITNFTTNIDTDLKTNEISHLTNFSLINCSTLKLNDHNDISPMTNSTTVTNSPNNTHNESNNNEFDLKTTKHLIDVTMKDVTNIDNELLHYIDDELPDEELSKDLEVPSTVPSFDTSWRPSPIASAFKPVPGRATFGVLHVPDRSSEMTSQLRTSERARLRASSVEVTTAPSHNETRAERIARYKEERRKQLTAQYGTVPTSSSSGVESPSIGITDSVTKRYISRDDKGCVSEPLRNIRTTKTSRLRAAAVTGAPSPPFIEIKSAPEVKSRLTRRSSKIDSPDVSSSSAPSSDVPSRESTPQCVKHPTVEKAEKDKSSKRKSNLNRSLTEEPVPVVSSDSTATDDNSVGTRRRRKPLTSRSSSMGAGCNVPTSLRTTCLPQRPPANNPTPPTSVVVQSPAVFQRLQCNLRPVQPVRRTPERKHSTSSEKDVSKRVDALMAKTKEFEARMDRLANKKQTNRLSPSKNINKNLIIKKTDVKENEINLQQSNDIMNDNNSDGVKNVHEMMTGKNLNNKDDEVTVSVTIKAKPSQQQQQRKQQQDLFIDEDKLLKEKSSSPPKIITSSVIKSHSLTRKSPTKNLLTTNRSLSVSPIKTVPIKLVPLTTNTTTNSTKKSEDMNIVQNDESKVIIKSDVLDNNISIAETINHTSKTNEENNETPQNLDELIAALATTTTHATCSILTTTNNNQLQDTSTSSDDIKTIKSPTILKSPSESPERKRKTSILKKKSLDESNTPISILKHKDDTIVVAMTTQPTEIVTTTTTTTQQQHQRPASILKKRASLEEHQFSIDDDIGILRRRSSREELEERSFSPEPTGILKLRTNSVSETSKPILKKKSSEDLHCNDVEVTVTMRPILKKKTSTDEEMDIVVDKPRPILKSGRRSADGGDEGSNYSSATGSPARRSSPCVLEEAVVRNQVALHLRFVEVEDTVAEHNGECDETNVVVLPVPNEVPIEQHENGDLLDEEPDVSERRLSVSERAQLFMRLSELNRQDADITVRSRDHLQRRERAKRFSTQPVTSEEVDEARGQLQNQAASTSTAEPTAGSLSSLQPTADDEEEPSQLSLADRVRLFDDKIRAQQHAATPPLPPSGATRRRTFRRTVTSTRFRTLPVTEAEVEQVVSPLAASLTKPPDPGVLGGLSARAAREAMFEHASKILSKPSTSQEINFNSELTDTRPKGILKHSSSVPPSGKLLPPLQVSQPSPVTPVSESEEADIVRGILKIPASAIQQARLIAAGNPSATTVKSALKKESSFDEPSPRVGILKPESTEWSEASSSEDDAVTGVTQDLASILNSVANDASELHAISSSEECDTSSSGGREVKTIIGFLSESRVPIKQKEMVAGTSVLSTGTTDLPVQQQQQQYSNGETEKPIRTVMSETSSPVKEVKIHCKKTKIPNVLERLSLSPGPQRSKTQSSIPDKASSVSIAERLAALKHSGETDWKKRVQKSPERPTTNGKTNGSGMAMAAPLQTSASMPGTTGGILAEKLNQLDKAAQDWKKRVGPNDAIEFSVAGRMGLGSTPLSSPVLQAADRKKKTPKPARFRSRIAGKNENRSAPGSPHKMIGHALTRSISAPGGNETAGQTVEVPSPHDETFAAFFAASSTVTSTTEVGDVSVAIADFEELTQHTLLVQHKRTVKMQRRRLGSRNPVKALAARTDLLQEYQEVRTGAAEREMKRLNVEKLAKNSNLAVEALAGLASKEDFTAVALKKASSSPTSQLLPYQELMLLQVKGRRHVQTRLVEPIASSINCGDSYILVTPSAVYNWLGRLSNVIERTRSAEVALQISQRKELGCVKAGGNVHTIDEGKIGTGSSVHRRAFWRLLGVEDGDGEATAAGHPDEDENYEACVTDTNMVYTVEGDELVPVERYWGCLPRIDMLDPSKVLIFDFGAELYIWSGKNASPETRKCGVNLARELWESGVDYSECDLSPVRVVTGPRPSWALLGKLSQHMESALFREKFMDWPEFTRLIRVKDGDNEDKQVDATIEVLPLDVNEMLSAEWTEPDLELEGSHLGRGDSYFDPETHRVFEVSTSAVTIWHIEEFGCHELPPESLGHFHTEDSFVVRWNYSITVTGRELSGAPSKHAMVGRSRCAYFFWQGAGASISDQGAAALLTVELDKEQGPHVRVEQGAEPSAFLRLFSGHMTIHAGHREGDDITEERWRLYLVRSGGTHSAESSLVQVPCSTRQLRSRTCLLLLDTEDTHVWVWHGSQSHKTTRTAALAAAHWLRDETPAEFGIDTDSEVNITEIKEGYETEQFFARLGGTGRQLYASLPPCKSLPPLRMFHLSSVSGSFAATEVLSPARTKDPPLAFPFRQSDLYLASQPALFLLDAGTELWLWQGWWGDDGGEEAAGSGAVRWQAERRAAMHTALDYWHHTRKGEVKAYLVWAGLEPLEFTNLFPQWSDRDDAAECNIQDGRKAGEVLDLEAELARLTRSTYPPAQLLQRPLPDGVDPTRLEDYLAPSHFEELLGMSKEEFMELPSWKQTNVKKDAGLF